MVSTRNQAYTSAATATNTTTTMRRPHLCTCCTEEKPKNDFPRTTPTKLCQHKVTICATCLDQWITTSIATQYRTSLRCPYPSCPEEICPRQDLNQGREHQTRIWQISDRIFKDKNPDWRWCLNPACDSGQQHIAPKPAAPDWPAPLNLFTCRKCRALSCATCDVLWHEGRTCEEYAKENMRRLVEVAVDGKIIDGLKEGGRIKECPNCCCLIEVVGSTGEVECSRCLYSFEWRMV